jgi:2-methylcitrate dehydratase PrpD
MAFRGRVEATLDPNRAADSAAVTVTMADGSRYVSQIEHGVGSAARPMTDTELEVKFSGMAVPVLDEQRTRALMRQCWDLEDLSDAGALARAAA